MVKRLVKLAGRAMGTARDVLFVDPNLLYKEEQHLVNKPFLFEGDGSKGVLLVHGWTSTPYEVRRLGKFLNENGYTVYGIQLKGHGSVPKDLEGVKWRDWMIDVKEGFEKLKQSCERVYVGGTSIGGNLALLFAKENKDVAGVIAMATPYKMKLEPAALFVAKSLVKMKKRYRKKWYPPTFGLSTTITRLISYQTYPVVSVLEAFNIVKEVRKNLSSITQPCFVLQSNADHIVSRDSMERIYSEIGSSVKKKKYVDKAYHTFISDIRNEHVFEDILNFLDEN